MIGKLDRYVGRVFLSSWLVSAVFFIGLFGVFDFFGRVDDLVETLEEQGDVPVGMLWTFYLYHMPSIVLVVSPFIMMVAALFTLSRLERHNEFMAMMLVGRSRRRIMAPVFALTVVFAGLLVCVQELVVPTVAIDKLELEARLFHADELVIDSVEMRDSEGRQFRAARFHPNEQLIEKLSVSFSDDMGRLIHISGEDATWDEIAGGWRLERGESVVHPAQPDGHPETVPAMFAPTDIQPEDLLLEHLNPFDLPYSSVLDRSERYPLKPTYRLLRHYHVTYPLSVVLLVFLGVPMILRRRTDRRGGRLPATAMAVGVCMAFLVLDSAMRDLGQNGALAPAVAAWVPVIIAGSLAFLLMDSLDR